MSEQDEVKCVIVKYVIRVLTLINQLYNRFLLLFQLIDIKLFLYVIYMQCIIFYIIKNKDLNEYLILLKNTLINLFNLVFPPFSFFFFFFFMLYLLFTHYSDIRAYGLIELIMSLFTSSSINFSWDRR